MHRPTANSMSSAIPRSAAAQLRGERGGGEYADTADTCRRCLPSSGSVGVGVAAGVVAGVVAGGGAGVGSAAAM